MVVMLPFRSLAESWRMLSHNRLRRRSEVICGNILACKDPYVAVSFLYPVDGRKRLSDEDFREIFFLLTDAYPEEVYDDPDPIHLLSTLSETELTQIDAASVMRRIDLILDAEDNEVRAKTLRPCFDRIARVDLFAMLMRLSVRASPVTRRDVMQGIAKAYDQPFHQIRTSVNLFGMQNTLNTLSLGSFDYSTIRPLLGSPLVMPAPSMVASIGDVKFGKCFAESLEGVYVTLHNTPAGVRVFDVGGVEIEDVDWAEGWVSIASVPHGIFLCDYAENRDNPMMMVDWLSPDDPSWTFFRRRKIMESMPPWALKPMQVLDAPHLSDGYAAMGQPYLLRNSASILSYENTMHEVVLVVPESPKERILRVMSGRVVPSTTGGPPRLLWALGARDGFDYLKVAECESSFDFNHYCAPYKRQDGEAIRVETPLFVKASIASSGWGDIGPYADATITGLAPSAGINDCLGAEELGYADLD